MQLPQVASSAAAAVAIGCWWLKRGGRGSEVFGTQTQREAVAASSQLKQQQQQHVATCGDRVTWTCVAGNQRRPITLDRCHIQLHSAAFNFNLNRKSATLLCCCCLSGRDASLRFIWHLQQHRMRHCCCCCCCCLRQVHMHWLWLLLLPLLLALACCKWRLLPLKVEDDALSDCNNRAKT